MKIFFNTAATTLLSSSLLIGSLVTNDMYERSPSKAFKIRVEITADQDAPLKIVELKRPQRPGEPPYVHVTNTSTLKTTRFWVEAVVISDKGGVYRTNDNAPNEFWPAERIILPAADGWTRETVLQTSSLAIAAKELHSACILVVPRVMRVEFVDGTSWSSTLADSGQPLRSRFRASEEACPDSATASDRLEPFPVVTIENTFRPDAPGQSEEGKFYAYSCPIAIKDKESVARCPF